MRRTLDSYELVFVRRGVLPIRISDKHVYVAANDLALLPLGVEHAGTEAITADVEFYWMHFRIPCEPYGHTASTDRATSTKSTNTALSALSASSTSSTSTALTESTTTAIPTSTTTQSRTTLLHVLADNAAVPQDDHYLVLPDLVEATDGDRLTVMFTQLLDVYATYGPHHSAYGDYFATSLLLEVSAQERLRRSGTAQDPGLATMQSVQSWIHANAFENITVAKVAQHFHYSPSYLTALYRRVFGIGIVEQIAECRVNRARDLLSSTSSPVADIAHEVGYDDPKYFMRVFKRRTGLTPKQYREAFAIRMYNTE